MTASRKEPLPPDLWCAGPILEAVQRARVFADSKDFVDSPLRPEISHEEVSPSTARRPVRAGASSTCQCSVRSQEGAHRPSPAPSTKALAVPLLPRAPASTARLPFCLPQAFSRSAYIPPSHVQASHASAM